MVARMASLPNLSQLRLTAVTAPTSPKQAAPAEPDEGDTIFKTLPYDVLIEQILMTVDESDPQSLCDNMARLCATNKGMCPEDLYHEALIALKVPRNAPRHPSVSWKERFVGACREDAALRAQCYAREVMPHFRPGDVLLYRMDVWHRGTPVHPGHVRYAHNLAWKRRDARGICHWNAGWTQKMYGGWLETFVCSLNETQRSTLGFPRLAALAPEVREATRVRYLSRL